MNLLNGTCNNCIYGDGKLITCNECEGMVRGGFSLSCNLKAENSFICYQNAYSFDDTSNNSNYLPQPQYENYLCNLFKNNSHDGYDCQQQFPFVYEQESSYNQNYDDNFYPHESPSFPCCDNCGESHETFQCQPIDQNVDFSELLCMHDNFDDLIESALNSKLLSINSQRLDKEKQEVKNVVEQPTERGSQPEYSPSMGYEDPNTTLETESDEIIKSGVEELVQILSENEVTLEYKRECDVPVCENSTICNDHSEIFFDSKNDDDISSDDDDFEDIEYVEASLPDPEIVRIEEENVVHQEEEEDVHLEDVFQIQDVVLREKLLSINCLIANIESLNDNPTSDRVLNSSVSIPISGEYNNSLSDNFLPEFKTFCDHTKDTRSERLINVVKNNISDDPLLEEADLFLAFDNLIPLGIENFPDDSEGDICFLKALLIDDSILIPNNESSESSFDNSSFLRPPPKPLDVEFDFELDAEILIVMNGSNEFKCLDPKNEYDEDNDYFPFMFVIRIFLSYLICSKMFISFLFAESEDTIFDPGISI
uniref:Pre-mRNA splicing Prp18-interacting factor n=1 Tax=Tanacetum cinerariifolium TaxID=118510 RepID=A0A6L2KLU4_TANCI|nr:hypothetical protein [Tanacetum cinerariifolium]